jgi:hypothetical protein
VLLPIYAVAYSFSGSAGCRFFTRVVRSLLGWFGRGEPHFRLTHPLRSLDKAIWTANMMVNLNASAQGCSNEFK